MPWLQLPEPETGPPLAFPDAAGAKAWLEAQARTQPLLMLELLAGQVDAVDGTDLAPAQGIELLNVLHGAILPVQASLEVRYTRKALPMPDDERRIFMAAQQLWTRLGIAYLRRVPHFAPPEKCLPLQRAANAFRLAQYAHFLAACECPPLLDQLLFAVLVHAEGSGILRQPLSDPDYPHLPEAQLAGLVAWALLLRLIDPYRLTAPQLTVANRALSRWRELCSFQAEPERSAPGQLIPLVARFAGQIPDGAPQWLNIRSVMRKIRGRIDALRAGDTPEALKLGRELSNTACLRLLNDIEHRLQAPAMATTPAKLGDIALVFGGEHAYAVFTGERLNPDSGMDVKSQALANQRMAVFGFDQVSRLPTAVRKLHIPEEHWTRHDGRVTRPPGAGARRLAPCLVASLHGGQPRLGVLRGLLSDAAGTLKASLDWYPGQIEGCRLRPPGRHDQKLPPIAVFLLRQAEQMSLILPPNAALRPGFGLAIEGSSIQHLIPGEVLDRGIDFVRYACRPG
ncbi:MAG: hypothetical protein ACM3X0_14230 [Bacteroidota bacterium]